MGASARSYPVLLALGLTTGSCAGSQVRTLPDAEPGRAAIQGSRTAVDRLVAQFLGPGLVQWLSPRSEGRLTVLEDGVPTEWRALAVEYRRELAGPPGPCRPARGFELYAWRPAADSGFIETLWFQSPLPAGGEETVFGDWRPCWNNQLIQPGPRLHVRWQGDRLSASRLLVGAGGQGRVEAAGASARRRCRQAAHGGEVPCAIELAVTVDAMLAPQSETADLPAPHPRTIVIPRTVVPGVRLSLPCDPGFPGCTPASRYPLPAYLPWSDGAFFRSSDRYHGTWRGQPVHRTVVQMRFKPAVPDSSIEATLAEWDAMPLMRGVAGTLVVQLPDPGPAGGAFDQMVRRLTRHPQVESVSPLRAGPGEPAVSAGRLHAVVGGGRSNGGYLCLIPAIDPQQPDRRACRPFGPDGRAGFDSLPAYDVPIYALCAPEPGGGGGARILAAGGVRIEPLTTVTVHFPPDRCPRPH